jgi:Protein of unknown function (DUF3108)
LNRRARHVLIACAGWLLAGITEFPALQAASLPSFDATFQIMRGSLRLGTTEVSLSVEGDGVYRYESHTWPSSWISWLLNEDLRELSRGIIEAAGIRPLFYHYQRSGRRSTRTAELTFDWKTSTVVNNVADSTWEMTVPDGTLDKLSTQLGIMMELQNGTTGKTFAVADGGKLKEYAFEVIGTETVELPAGRFETVKLNRVGESREKLTYIWCAPELHYLPVRILQRKQDDSEYRRELERFSDSLRVGK